MAAAPFEPIATGFPGLLVLKPPRFSDARGTFVKTFHAGFFEGLGIRFTPRESFFSVSARGVLRGMHFQTPPAAHAKLVYCQRGRVLDVLVDLRRRSPRFKELYVRELDGLQPELLFIPAGVAHGFLTLEADTVVVYQTDVVHTPDCDAGVAWDSIGYTWPLTAPILSDRDRRWPRLDDYATPFNGSI